MTEQAYKMGDTIMVNDENYSDIDWSPRIFIRYGLDRDSVICVEDRYEDEYNNGECFNTEWFEEHMAPTEEIRPLSEIETTQANTISELRHELYKATTTRDKLQARVNRIVKEVLA